MAETTGSVTPAKAGGVAPGPQSGTGCGFARKGGRQVREKGVGFRQSGKVPERPDGAGRPEGSTESPARR